jgi:hypothetical protein
MPPAKRSQARWCQNNQPPRLFFAHFRLHMTDKNTICALPKVARACGRPRMNRRSGLQQQNRITCKSGGWQGNPKENRTGVLTGDVAGSLYVQPGALKQRRCGPFALSRCPNPGAQRGCPLAKCATGSPFNQWQTTDQSWFALVSSVGPLPI